MKVINFCYYLVLVSVSSPNKKFKPIDQAVKSTLNKFDEIKNKQNIIINSNDVLVNKLNQLKHRTHKILNFYSEYIIQNN